MDKTPESDSIKTALDIDTINFKDAKKYSFLNKEGHSVYEPKIDFAELSDFDLYANSQMQKPANKPDMKKLEAYFAVPAGKPKAEKNAPQPEVRKSASTKTAKPVVERQRKSNMKLLGKFRDRNNRKPNKTSTEEVDGDKSSKSIRKKGKRKNEGKGSDEKKSSGAGAFLQRLLRRKEVTIASKKEEKTAKTPPPVQKT
ncbi:hypothetical protein Y032_0071g530 [Ancylostoma ceylanicum]|uniref:Uncharacterized protein n=1 Tax=Ancylostoma ceylanicum TaxID=53326 RepID=A0A016TW01_9BILA|nr:hypothetical protein Y032_0071g530 [Ancylostoma ceylanicum]